MALILSIQMDLVWAKVRLLDTCAKSAEKNSWQLKKPRLHWLSQRIIVFSAAVATLNLSQSLTLTSTSISASDVGVGWGWRILSVRPEWACLKWLAAWHDGEKIGE